MWTATAVVVRRLNRALDPPVEAEQPLTGPFTNVTRVINEQLDGNCAPTCSSTTPRRAAASTRRISASPARSAATPTWSGPAPTS